MSDDMIELGKRAVASKWWRWMEGMRDQRGRILDEPPERNCYSEWGVDCHEWQADSAWGINQCDRHKGKEARYMILDGDEELSVVFMDGAIPDLEDAATLGCLLARVRYVWDNPRLVAIYCEPANPGQSEGWAVQCADNRMPVGGEGYASEAEALVAALEAEP